MYAFSLFIRISANVCRYFNFQSKTNAGNEYLKGCKNISIKKDMISNQKWAYSLRLNIKHSTISHCNSFASSVSCSTPCLDIYLSVWQKKLSILRLYLWLFVFPLCISWNGVSEFLVLFFSASIFDIHHLTLFLECWGNARWISCKLYRSKLKEYALFPICGNCIGYMEPSWFS